MYLKRVEISGFKSFADRTELEFPKGVTAVVGPNGSGKSNIADAVRWVLGEQSAKSLRGAKMEDVIFAGSDTRKAVNYSEVSLTLDNASGALPLDFTEVTVTRRLYRSGDSEYYINKSACRLKDITELFMDTGLGKEAYSIIGQGKIEEVLSNKSEERRGIFEEAAGIVKYKARKREAEKKLDETENNLIRLSDIISEIEEQIDPLQEQAKKARNYKELRAQLQNLEIGLYVYNIELTHERWQESQQKARELEHKQVSLAAEVNTRDAQIAEKRWQINRLDQELEDHQQQLLINVERLEKLEGELRVLEEREKNAQENRAASAEKMDRLLLKREDLNAQLEAQNREREHIQLELDRISKELEIEQERFSGLTARLEGDVEKLKSDYIELLGELATARNEQKNIDQQIQLGSQKSKRICDEIAQQSEHCSILLKQIEAYQDQEQQLVTQIEAALEQYRVKAQQLNALKEEQQKVALKKRQKEQQRDQLGSRIEVLKEMQADFAGFNQGVKEVLKARDSQLQGIHGAVAELITVPQKYEVAIEIALGQALQNVIVDDEKAGRAAIHFLKQHNLGRATFLPLSVMRSRRPSVEEEKRILAADGVYGLAADLISFTDTYRGVMENLLGSVIIANDLEVANQVARQTGQRFRIVTLEGDVVNPGGSMTGGAIKQKSNNLLGRGRAIEELEVDWKNIDRELNELLQLEKSAQEQEQVLHSALEDMRQLGEGLREQEQDVKHLLTREQTEYKNQEQRLVFLQQEQQQLVSESDAYESQLTQAQERLKALESEEAAMKLAIDLADQNKKDQETTKEEMSARITALKVERAQASQSLMSVNERIDRIQAEITENEADRVSLDQDIQQLFRLLAEKDELEAAFKAELENHRHAKNTSSQQIEDKRAARLQIHNEMEELENSAKGFRSQLRQMEDQLHKEVVKENRFEVELDNLLEKLREEYEMTFEAAKEGHPAPSDEDVTLVRQDVFRLKRDITALGEVNIGAIEEYDRLKERYEFLTHQIEDLKTARVSLYQVIHEMDQEMKKRFIESFEQISHQFRIVFTQLFGGGRADLILTDPEQLLDTGIEIVAQPPGKKLQNLALLSGGERALTAIALLFAILRVRPVPFCVLDEVEAALDEANVYRFASYLKEFSVQTQFIVITHRKGTMEGADVLYGVTMEGSGVSKLVSVKLDDFEKRKAGAV